MKKSIYVLFLSLISVAFLAGCGEDTELSRYKKEVEKFNETICKHDEAINSLDADSPTARTDLLEQLDLVNDAFQDFAALSVPREYGSVESLADEAATLMDEAVTQYHNAFAGETINDFDASLAYEKYCRAIVRINYIGDLLQGKELSGEGIVIIEDSGTETEE